jgi:hypothetical protein
MDALAVDSVPKPVPRYFVWATTDLQRFIQIPFLQMLKILLRKLLTIALQA